MRACAGLLGEQGHELGQFGAVDGGMVRDLAHLALGGKEQFEVSAPACGVFARALAANGGPVQDGLYASPNAAGGFGLIDPDRFENPQDVVRVD